MTETPRKSLAEAFTGLIAMIIAMLPGLLRARGLRGLLELPAQILFALQMRRMAEEFATLFAAFKAGTLPLPPPAPEPEPWPAAPEREAAHAQPRATPRADRPRAAHAATVPPPAGDRLAAEAHVDPPPRARRTGEVRPRACLREAEAASLRRRQARTRRHPQPAPRTVRCRPRDGPAKNPLRLPGGFACLIRYDNVTT
jgi:hypothetical protein